MPTNQPTSDHLAEKLGHELFIETILVFIKSKHFRRKGKREREQYYRYFFRLSGRVFQDPIAIER